MATFYNFCNKLGLGSVKDTFYYSRAYGQPTSILWTLIISQTGSRSTWTSTLNTRYTM